MVHYASNYNIGRYEPKKESYSLLPKYEKRAKDIVYSSSKFKNKKSD